MIELNGLKSDIKYNLNPDKVTCVYSDDGITHIMTDRVQYGSTLAYQVKEEVEEVLLLLYADRS